LHIFTNFWYGQFWVKKLTSIVAQNIPGGVGFGWVSFLLKGLAIGENNHGATIVLRARGRTHEKDTIAGYVFNGHRMCCP
jgi:hypothetical protein